MTDGPAERERTGADPDPSPPRFRVHGAESAVVSLPPADWPTGSVTAGFDCDTGASASGTWRGVPVAALLERTNPPADATHLLVESWDGYRVAVPVATAIEGVVATTLDGQPLPDARTRFVVPGLDSSRCVRDVRSIECLSLGPGDDPREHESTGG